MSNIVQIVMSATPYNDRIVYCTYDYNYCPSGADNSVADNSGVDNSVAGIQIAEMYLDTCNGKDCVLLVRANGEILKRLFYPILSIQYKVS